MDQLRGERFQLGDDQFDFLYEFFDQGMDVLILWTTIFLGLIKGWIVGFLRLIKGVNRSQLGVGIVGGVFIMFDWSRRGVEQWSHKVKGAKNLSCLMEKSCNGLS